jgi:hypothetical protein
VDRHPVQATAQLVDSLVAGRRRTVGLGHMLDRWFLFNAGMGLDASVVRGVDEKRGTGRPVTNLMYLQTAAAAFLKPELTDADITVEVPGRAPVSGVRFGFVSNTAPWTYLGPRAIRTNPGTDFDHGLGLFAATSTALLPSLALGAQLLAGSGDPRGPHPGPRRRSRVGALHRGPAGGCPDGRGVSRDAADRGVRVPSRRARRGGRTLSSAEPG